MTGQWKTRKTKQRFSNVSHGPWKSPKARFPHSRSPGADRVEKWKSKDRIPTFPLRLSKFKTRRKEDSHERPASTVVHAHRSIRKCFE